MKRRRPADSSLELLLDTITNTFGGVLFLAILVSLLLRTAAPPSSHKTEAGAVMSASEQAAHEVRLDDLRDQLTRLQRRKRSGPPPSPTAHSDSSREEATELKSRRATALEELAMAGLQTAEDQRARAEALDEAARLTDGIAGLRDQLSAAQRARDAAAEETERLARLRLTLERPAPLTTIEQTVGMPAFHETSKRQVGIYLRFGKIYLMHRWLNAVRAGPNPDFFVVAPGNPPVARPKPGAGVPIEAETASREMLRMLRPFPPDEWVVAIVVFHDSFDEFQLVKQAIVAADYEYQPILVGEGGSVFDSGGQGRAQ